MSADILRRAASKMRERAGEIGGLEPSPWASGERCVWASNGIAVVFDGNDGDGGALGPDHAEHIASWHPAVALAVADWLTSVANHLDWYEANGGMPPLTREPFAVARAYLGESA